MKILKSLKRLVKKVGTLSLAYKVVVFSLVMATMPAGTIQVNANAGNAEPYKSNIKFVSNQTMPVKISDAGKPNIIVGESNDDRVQREALEAQQKVAVSSSSTRNVVARESRPAPVDPDLATKRALAKSAAAKYGIDWRILEAVWQVESGKEWYTTTQSYAGAQGPMQFMRGTWNKYAVDGNGDGVADMYSAQDAVYAGANLLAQAGAAEGNVNSALLSYNHAQWYVDKVKGIAASISD